MMIALASRRGTVRRRLLCFAATLSMTLVIGVPAASAIEYPPGQFECGGGGVAGPELPAGALVLSGTVTNALGAPLEHVRVEVAAVPEAGEGSTVLGLASTHTDANGNWAFTDVGDARYRISFDPPAQGDPPAHLWQSRFWTSTGGTLQKSDAELVQLAGASETDLDIALPAEQWVELSGQVADPAGLGLEGVEVRAQNRHFGHEFCANTAADGTFTMLVRAAEYAVRVIDQSGSHPTGFYQAANPPSNFTVDPHAATLLVATADISGVDVRFPATYAIEGTVTDGADAIPQISLSACLASIADLCLGGGESDATGAFSMAGIPDGDYLVSVADFTGTYRNGYFSTSGITSDPGAADVVTVAGGDVTGIAVTTFANATMSGTVIDAAGLPLDGASVQVCDDDFNHCASGITDAAGSYVTGGLPPNDYTIQVSDQTGDHPVGYLTAGNGFSHSIADAVLVTVGEADVAGIDVQIPDGYRVSGVIQVHGQPGDGRVVEICLGPSNCVSGTSANFDGSFVTPALLPGSYLLGTFGDLGDILWYVEGSPGSYDPNAATPVSIVDAPVSGIVFDASEAPVDPATPTPEGTNVGVTLVDPGTGATPVTLVFDSVVGAGETSLTVSSEGPPVPTGFQLGDPPTYFEIETTATFSGFVEVCISYAGIELGDLSNVVMLHYDDAAEPPAWESLPTTVDEPETRVCALTDSFSPFALAERVPVFGGFESPVDDRPVLNRAKAGSSIPIKFSLGGDFGLAIFKVGSPTSFRTDCQATAVDAIESTVGPGASKLQYDAATGTYTYVWKTSKAWASSCRTLVLEFANGSTAEADFTFVK